MAQKFNRPLVREGEWRHMPIVAPCNFDGLSVLGKFDFNQIRAFGEKANNIGYLGWNFGEKLAHCNPGVCGAEICGIPPLRGGISIGCCGAGISVLSTCSIMA